MSTFPAVESYQAELQATDYRRLDDAALAEVRRRYAASRHSSAIEGIHPSAEQEAFYAMLHDLRVSAWCTDQECGRSNPSPVWGQATRT